MTLERVFRNIFLLLLFSKFAAARVPQAISGQALLQHSLSRGLVINEKQDLLRDDSLFTHGIVTGLYLDPDQHILWLKVRREKKSAGVWKSVPAAFTVIQPAEWWTSSAACTIFIILILGLICALYYYAFRYLELKRKMENGHMLHPHEIDMPQRKIVIQPSAVNPVSPDERLLQRVLEYVEERIDDSDLNIDEICGKMGLSRTQLYRKMKALTDLSMAELIKQIRLQRAQELLQGRKFHINEVCYMVGFTNSDYFRKCFKAHFGLAPTAYTRQQLRKLNQETEVSR